MCMYMYFIENSPLIQCKFWNNTLICIWNHLCGLRHQIIHALENSLRLNSVLPTNAAGHRIKTAAEFAKWRIFGFSRQLKKTIVPDVFLPHTVKVGNIDLKYENTYYENICVCFVRVNGHLLSLCLNEDTSMKWENLML